MKFLRDEAHCKHNFDDSDVSKKSNFAELVVSISNDDWKYYESQPEKPYGFTKNINYPSGFTRENSIVLTVNEDLFGDKGYPGLGITSGGRDIYSNVSVWLKENNVEFNASHIANDSCTYKIYLMKIS